MDYSFYHHKEFTIATSSHLSHGEITTGSGQPSFNLEDAIILSVKRSTPDSLAVRVFLSSTGGNEQSVYIFAKDDEGVEQLKVIETNADVFKDDTYRNLVNYKFNFDHEFNSERDDKNN